MDSFKRGTIVTAEHLEKAARSMVAKCIALMWLVDRRDPNEKESKEYIKNSIPETLKGTTSAADWEKAAKEEHKHMSRLDQVSAGREFLHVVQSWPLYGADVFDIKVVDDKIPKQILAISARGMQMIAKDTRVRSFCC